MPRPKKYHTADERREAKAANMRRSHHARRDAVNERRRELYAENARRQRKMVRRMEKMSRKDDPDNEGDGLVPGSSSKQKKAEAQLQETHRVETIRSNQARVSSIRAAVKRTLQGSAKSYLDRRCTWFEVDLRHANSNMSIEVIETHLKNWTGLLEKLKPCMDEIYQMAGYGEEYVSANLLQREIQTMVQWLEDILCTALVDPLNVVRAFKNGELLYQDEMRDNGET